MKTVTGMSNIIKDLNGKPILDGEFDERGQLIPDTLKPINVGRMMANILARGSSSDSIRIIDLAIKLYNLVDDEFEFEDADSSQVQTTVTQDQRSTNIVKAAILKIFVEEEEKEED